MKKIILLFIIGSVLILLTGCGIFNLNGWIMPDDGEFLACIGELSTPQKIGDYMLENFTYEAHNFYAPDPYTLWKTKKGDCNDMVTFSTWVADYHGYKTWQIEIFYSGSIYKHWIAVYLEDNYSITIVQYYYSDFDTFKKIVEFNNKLVLYNKKWSKYIVYDYDMDIVETGCNN